MSTTTTVVSIGRRDLLLLLVGLGVNSTMAQGVGGITRLQKLLFLLEREGQIKLKGEEYAFEPYKAGPYSPKLYDDLEFLENVGLIDRRTTAEGTDAEAAEIDFTFENLIGDTEVEAPDAYEEYRYCLTQKGKEKVEQLLANSGNEPIVESVRAIKSRYGRYSLDDLLYYVYTRYPEMTTESEIKEKVLRRNHSRQH